jgi:uncharacterized peroxidase-related enzyme
MARLQSVDPAAATGKAKELLDRIQAAFGVTPNAARVMAVNPAVLEGWLHLSTALGTTLTPKLNERIAIAIAQANGCGYCLSAHTAVGGMVGLDAGELDASRRGRSADAKAAAALRFALEVNARRGQVSDEDIARVRAAGYDDRDIAAIVGHVALNVLTNAINLVAQTELDFPEVTPMLPEAA